MTDPRLEVLIAADLMAAPIGTTIREGDDSWMTYAMDLLREIDAVDPLRQPDSAGTLRRVPNKRAPGVRLHAFGIPDELWERVQAAAKYNGDEKQISEIVRKALLAYVKRTEAKMRADQ